MNPLADLIPATARLYVYGALTLLALGFAAWQASDGNWTIFVGSLITALVHALAASNTPSKLKA